MKFSDNPYYSPEKCGLEIIENIDTAGSYEFDMFVVWKKLDDNTLWWDTDSGCSCPTPFDNSDHSHELKQITKETFFNFEEALKNHYNIATEDFLRIKKVARDFLKNNKQKKVKKNKPEEVAETKVTLSTELVLTNFDNTIKVYCPDEHDSEMAVTVINQNTEVCYSLNIDEAEQVRDFLTNHINELKKDENV